MLQRGLFTLRLLKKLLNSAKVHSETINYRLDYGRLTTVLVEAIKEQQQQIESLKQLLNVKDLKMKKIQEQVDEIKRMVEQLTKR